MKKTFLIIVLLNSLLLSQAFEINKIEPPNWWANHTYNNIQLLIYGKNLDSVKVKSSDSNFIIQKVIYPENNNYLFVNVKLKTGIGETNPKILFSKDGFTKKLNYQILKRKNNSDNHKGFSNEDVVYLIFPDRFCDGDTTNNFFENEKEEFEFKGENGRFGGDIQGIINKLDYLKKLGVTAIWITPLLENDMYMSYHGYAATDFYKVDARQGTNELYKRLVEEAHKKGIKVIYDHVANHIGINHEWIGNLPTKTWLNGTTKDHLPASHYKVVYVDIYSDSSKMKTANEGWFVDYMPDLNQRDTLLANYLIQNTIWWIEFSGIDGIREDTYPYVNPDFMSKWAKTILTHYPKFNIVGEVWKGEAAYLAAYQKDSKVRSNFNTNLPAVTDFAMRDAIASYLAGENNLNRIYETLGKDFLYSNPNNLLLFFDNHDTDRAMYIAKNDLFKFKVALALVLTTRGIPQLFYGTEIGLNGGGHHNRIREAFPGGFSGDSLNAFAEKDRTTQQNEIYNFTKQLLALRNKYRVMRTGKFVQYVPENDFYVYKKKLGDEKIIVAINDSEEKRNLNFKDYFKEGTYSEVTDLLNNKKCSFEKNKVLEQASKTISIYLIR
ncbi:MAG: alpha-amlyase [Ignavibacteriae bacterium]|nr:MAG: alpha-amlyase [Ignavibacteriota bacterium]